MTRKRQPPKRTLFLTAALDNPALREVEAEYSIDAPSMADVWQCAAFAGVAAAFAFGLAHWFAVMADIPGYATQTGLAGLVGLMALVGYAYLLHVSRRTRQWATFDRQPGDTVKAPEFVPVSDSPRTLVLDFPLRPKVEKWARLVQAEDGRLAYPLWTGKGKVFSRGEYDAVRATLRSPALSYEADDQLTQRGRNAVGRWAVGSFQAREVHEFRAPPPAGALDVRDD